MYRPGLAQVITVNGILVKYYAINDGQCQVIFQLSPINIKQYVDDDDYDYGDVDYDGYREGDGDGKFNY